MSAGSDPGTGAAPSRRPRTSRTFVRGVLAGVSVASLALATAYAVPPPALQEGAPAESQGLQVEFGPVTSPAPQPRVVEPFVPSWTTGDPTSDPRPRTLPVPSSLQERVAFWREVWTEVPDHVHLLVDSRRPWIVHDRVTCAKEAEHLDEKCQRQVVRALKRVKARLRGLARRPTRAHRRAYSGSRSLMRTAADSLRRVAGKKDALARAVIRAGDDLYLAEQAFAAAGLPRALSRLGFVESLYRSDAESRAGAVGTWQFTATTARTYLTVDGGVDERFDPARSAWAAARYLQQLQGSLQRWPLAVTAYNAGPTRMRRLVRAHRTRDLGRIIARARDRRFGFDGENYYAQLVAVAEATQELPSAVVKPLETVRLTRAMPLAELAKELEVSEKALRESNPALRRAVTHEGELVPASYLVNRPRGGHTLSRRDAPSGPHG